MENYNPFQLREIFHLEFLRWLGKKVNLSYYALKGGVNLRFFYNSFRYSEDMDFNARIIKVSDLRNKVTQILKSTSFQNNLQPFGISEIIPPDVARAKQTLTIQRFKVHLITAQGEDFFTKIEFSRRKFENNIKIETVSSTILREYKLAPLLAPHYDITSMVSQKIEALENRKIIQARDAFDIYILSTQIESADREKIKLNPKKITKSCENIYEISFEQFRDSVVAYLSAGEQKIYDSSQLWDEIRLKTVNFIEGLE